MKKNTKTRIISTCDLCGSKKNKLFLSLNEKSGNYRYVVCIKCRLVWLSNVPKNISIHYPKSYKAHKNNQATNKAQEIVRTLIRKNKLIARLLIEDQLYFEKKKGKILDVGAGNGHYVSVLRGWGWDAHGVEVSKNGLAAAAKNRIELRHGTLKEAKYPDNYFEVIRYSHVLEHVSSPAKEIAEAKRVIKKNGKILILVPNIDSLFAKLFRSNWYMLDAPRHLYQFSPSTLKKILRNNGFTHIKVKYIQSPYSPIRSILIFFKKTKIEKRVGLLILPLGLALRVLNLCKMSDTIEVTAVKT